MMHLTFLLVSAVHVCDAMNVAARCIFGLKTLVAENTMQACVCQAYHCRCTVPGIGRLFYVISQKQAVRFCSYKLRTCNPQGPSFSWRFLVVGGSVPNCVRVYRYRCQESRGRQDGEFPRAKFDFCHVEPLPTCVS